MSSSRLRLFRRHGDRSLELPAQFNDLRVQAYDANAGVALASGGGQLVRFDVESLRRTVFPGTFLNPPALRGGRPVLVEKRAPGRWQMLELADDGTTKLALEFDWPVGAGTPFLRCSPFDNRRCIVGSKDRDTMHIARVGDDRVGARLTIDGISGMPDVTADGRVLAPALDRVVEVSLPSGAVRTVAQLETPECMPRWVRADEAARRFWLVQLCPDRFAIGVVREGRGTGFEEVEANDGWISSVEVLEDGDVLYSIMDWDPQLAILDGL
jgi:hypothetical protein